MTHTDIFLQLKDGTERHFRITDRDLPMRPGHRLHLAFAKCRDQWEIGLVYNESIDTYWEVPVDLGPKGLRAWPWLVSQWTSAILVLGVIGGLIAAGFAWSDKDLRSAAPWLVWALAGACPLGVVPRRDNTLIFFCGQSIDCEYIDTYARVWMEDARHECQIAFLGFEPERHCHK